MQIEIKIQFFSILIVVYCLFYFITEYLFILSPYGSASLILTGELLNYLKFIDID